MLFCAIRKGHKMKVSLKEKILKRAIPPPPPTEKIVK